MPEDMENVDIIDETQELEDESLEIKDTTSEEEEETKTFSGEEVEEKIKERLGRANKKYNRELSKRDQEIEKYRQLEKSLRVGFEVKEGEDVLEKINEYYKDQGMEMPKVEPVSNKRDGERLGELDAQDLIDSSEFEEIQERANELASLKQKGKMTHREEAEFMKIGSYLTNQLKINKLKEKGVSEDILTDKSFKDFTKKFNSDTPITDIYDLYSKINHKETEKPASTGSIKSSGEEKRTKEFYTSKEVDNLKSSDLDNPTILKNVMASMKKWGK